jgi:Ca2+-binding EF-hand superfamily protein
MSLILFGTLVMTFSVQAAGQRGAMDPMDVFEHADANHDGNITRAEYVAARAAKFDELDRNHDGFLTEADFPRLKKAGGERAEKFQAMLQKLDTDHDGKVSRDEFANGGGTLFDMADTNHDGVVDKAELQQAVERMKSREH